ncbi:Uncharacterised protein [Serratia quinivorans]|jgi:hypothetical protein|nr:Uncharacterised protein [Serratia quinivorans]CAI1699714.1 Uncharacterised protein [Serratia quinivorans]CAI1720980.1 Uncharacterised protein [Serratia quinivorans]
MKTTRHYHFTGNDPVTIETDQSANMCQISGAI